MASKPDWLVDDVPEEQSEGDEEMDWFNDDATDDQGTTWASEPSASPSPPSNASPPPPPDASAAPSTEPPATPPAGPPASPTSSTAPSAGSPPASSPPSAQSSASPPSSDEGVEPESIDDILAGNDNGSSDDGEGFYDDTGGKGRGKLVAVLLGFGIGLVGMGLVLMLYLGGRFVIRRVVGSDATPTPPPTPVVESTATPGEDLEATAIANATAAAQTPDPSPTPRPTWTPEPSTSGPAWSMALSVKTGDTGARVVQLRGEIKADDTRPVTVGLRLPPRMHYWQGDLQVTGNRLHWHETTIAGDDGPVWEAVLLPEPGFDFAFPLTITTRSQTLHTATVQVVTGHAFTRTVAEEDW